MACPCGLPDEYDTCCGKYHRDEAIAQTAELLMRSRYSAFVKHQVAYLKATTWPANQKLFFEASYMDRATDSLWLGLEIHNCEGGSADDTRGTVSFTARSMIGGKTIEQSENSLFKKKGGRWYYVKAL